MRASPAVEDAFIGEHLPFEGAVPFDGDIPFDRDIPPFEGATGSGIAGMAAIIGDVVTLILTVDATAGAGAGDW